MTGPKYLVFEKMSSSEPAQVRRLLIVSSRSRNKVAITASLLTSTIRLEYDYETANLADLVIFKVCYSQSTAR